MLMEKDLICFEEEKETEEKTYLDIKVEMLKDFCLNDSEAIKAYLEKHTEGMPEGEKKEITLNRLCRDLIMAYYNGDRTYTKPRRRKAV